MNHLLKKQIFLLTVAPSLDVFAIQHAASLFYRQSILPVLEKIFDELSVEGEVLQLDKLEIDLGTLPERALHNDLANEELSRIIRTGIETALTRQVIQQTGGLQRISAHQHAWMQWWYYMEHGRLHWTGAGLSEKWHMEVLETLSVDHNAISQLRNAILYNPTQLTRICTQNGDAFLETLTGILVAEKLTGLSSLIGELLQLAVILNRHSFRTNPDLSSVKKAVQITRPPMTGFETWASRAAGWLQPGFLDRRFRMPSSQHGNKTALWQQMIRKVIASWKSKWSRNNEAALFNQLLNQWRKQQAEFLSRPGLARKDYLWKALLILSVKNPSLFRQNGATKLLSAFLAPLTNLSPLQWKTAGLPGQSSFLPSAPSSSRHGASVSSGEAIPAQDRLRSEEVYDLLQHSLTGKNTGEEPMFSLSGIEEEGLFIPNAGLILLHPFLATCFSYLQWWNGKEFTGSEARINAVYLLHYLATGEENPPEYALVLPKILCGYDPEWAPPGMTKLPEQALEEAENLLTMVISRWEKLQGSSISGLRDTFLQRHGKLKRHNEHLILQIEQGAFDVLLDYLPWGLSIVKLPWLSEIIHVEWR